MSKILASLGGNTGAMVAGGGMCAALALGAYISFGVPQETRQIQASAPQPVVQSTVQPPQPAELPSEQVAAVQPQTPTFDELRRETDGTTIIAGRAEPMSEVKILLDGAEVATAKADSTGGFAAIAVLPPKEDAQVVSLSAQTGEETTASLDEIILAPTARATREPSVDETPQQEKVTAQAETPAPAPQETQPTQEATAGVQEATAGVQEATAGVQEATAPEPEPEATQQAIAEPVEAVEPAQPAEPQQVAVLQSNEQGVRLLGAAQPEAMTSVALDTIGYSDIGDVQLTGRAQADTAKVRVYLDNRSVITLPVGADGRWRGDLPDVDEGVYTLRVDEVSAQGTVSSRVETPFKRESAEVLAAAAAKQDGPVKSITVQTGATLWAIARDRYGDGTLFVRVFEANAGSIRNPDLIYPGQVFDLPN